jgi:hypothetical protein
MLWWWCLDPATMVVRVFTRGLVSVCVVGRLDVDGSVLVC